MLLDRRRTVRQATATAVGAVAIVEALWSRDEMDTPLRPALLPHGS